MGAMNQRGPSFVAAIVLAGGQGRRMNSQIRKQYLELEGKPLIYHALAAFESSCVQKVILVTGAGETEYCRKQIVERYGFSRVAAVVEGGKERYDSVYSGLCALERLGGCSHVLIHDGARPLVDKEIIRRAADGAVDFGACVAGMPVKDTIKETDETQYGVRTPRRDLLWAVQTPQAFEWKLIWNAYSQLMTQPELQEGITDDAMVLETVTGRKSKLIPGSYSNIKVTTPEDMIIAEAFLKERRKEK